MGILNVTPDSFSDGGKFSSARSAIDHAVRMGDEGADIIDIGGESTRPGSDAVTSEEEIRRVVPVIEELVKKISVPISIDTYKSDVARAALEAGARIVNDISGFAFDGSMPSVAAMHKATAVLMHIQGTPKLMQQHPQYKNVTEEVKNFLEKQIGLARTAGVEQIIVDPGIGFGKTLAHNVTLFKELESFRSLGCPVLVGPSRKSFLGTLLDLPVEERVEGTAAAVAVSILRGAHIVRVHDVQAMKRVAIVTDALR